MEHPHTSEMIERRKSLTFVFLQHEEKSDYSGALVLVFALVFPDSLK